WDAWRRDDGTWVVIATFPIPPNTHVATWTYDSGSRTMTVVDDNAGTLSAIDPHAPLHLAAARPMLSTVAPLEDEEEDESDDEPAVITSRSPWGQVRAEQPDEGQSDEDEDEDEALSLEDQDLGEPAGQDLEESALEEAPEADEPLDSQDVDPVDVPADSDAEADAALDGARDETPDDAPDDDAADSGPTADAEDVPLFPTPPATAHRTPGKPSVPSFDDILFGPGPGK
ncbi:MAG TPA: septation protein SepH, partial [Candidatus Limnocylindrales bacterium]|nr:septation protein SepH [Candidatus Limnocylindrales bacterium]